MSGLLSTMKCSGVEKGGDESGVSSKKKAKILTSFFKKIINISPPYLSNLGVWPPRPLLTHNTAPLRADPHISTHLVYLYFCVRTVVTRDREKGLLHSRSTCHHLFLTHKQKRNIYERKKARYNTHIHSAEKKSFLFLFSTFFDTFTSRHT